MCGNTQAGFSADCICASPICRIKVQSLQPAEPATGRRGVAGDPRSMLFSTLRGFVPDHIGARDGDELVDVLIDRLEVFVRGVK
jgi:hypothetical protein